jgi:adenylate cyclase
VFVVQDDITDAVSRAIGAAITRAEQQRAIRKPSENLDAWEAYQRALWHHGKGGPSDVERARHFLERAIKLDPLFAPAYAMLAFTRIYDANLGAPFALPDALAKAKVEARTAIEFDPDEPSALVAMAWVAWSEGDHVTAVQSAEQAISVDPNHAGAYLVKGMALAYSGSTSEAREACMIAMRLSPRDPMSVIMRLLLIVSHYFERDYVKALATARSAIRDYVEYPSPYRYLAASLGQLGHARDANEALQQAMDVSPADFDRYVGSRRPWFRPVDYEHVLDGLRKAGWHG